MFLTRLAQHKVGQKYKGIGKFPNPLYFWPTLLGGSKTYRKFKILQVLLFSIYIKRLRGWEKNSENFFKKWVPLMGIISSIRTLDK